MRQNALGGASSTLSTAARTTEAWVMARSRPDAESPRWEQRTKSEGFALCGWSGETFDTARIITPPWLDVPTHLESLAALSGFAVVVTCFVALTGWIGSLVPQGR